MNKLTDNNMNANVECIIIELKLSLNVETKKERSTTRKSQQLERYEPTTLK